MDKKEKLLIGSIISGIEGQLAAIKVMMTLPPSDEKYEATPVDHQPEDTQYLNDDEEKALDSMMDLGPEKNEGGFLSVPPIPENPIPIPDTLIPASGGIAGRSIESGMEREMSAFMTSIAAHQNEDAQAVNVSTEE